MPPSLGLLSIAFLLERASFLGCFDNRLITVRIKQLPSVVLNFYFLHLRLMLRLHSGSRIRNERLR